MGLHLNETVWEAKNNDGALDVSKDQEEIQKFYQDVQGPWALTEPDFIMRAIKLK